MAADTNTTVANSSYAGAYGYGFQANIHFTGEAWKFIYYPGNGTTTPACKVAYGDPDSGVFSAAHDVPNASQTTNRGYKICSTWNPVLYKHVYLWVSNYGKGFIKNDDVFTASTAIDAVVGLAGFAPPGGMGTHDLLHGCTIYDRVGRIWMCDTISTMTGIRVKRSSAALDNENWGGYVDIVTGLSPNNVLAATLIPFHHNADQGDIGCVYAHSTSIYFKPFDDSTSTWGAQETVVSGTNYDWRKWSAVSTVDGEVVVFWSDSTTTTTIKCRIRNAAGTWGTVFDAATDNTTNYTFPATNNLGSDNQVFFYYYDGTNLVMNSITAGILGSKFTMVASLPAVKTYNMQAPRQSINKFGVIYHEDSTNDIKLATHSSAPVEHGTSGKLVSSLAFQGFGTFSFAKQISDYGDLSFVTWVGYDGKSYANVYNNVTSAWVYSATAMSPYGYCDAHNVAACTISSDGYVYLGLAGRITPFSTQHHIVKKSDYPLTHGSFTLSAFTDISPSSTGITTGRGYKYLCVDSNGILHYASVHINVLVLRNYNGSTWTTYAAGSIADFDTLGTTNYFYVDGVLLGKESSGQQTLNIALSYWDATHGTPYAAYKCFFMRVTMQGDRSYLAADIGGTSITLPLDETYTTGNALYFDGSVETTLLRSQWNGFDILEDNTPCIVSIMWTTGLAFSQIRATTWSGSAWVNVNTGATWSDDQPVFGTNKSMVTYHDVNTDRITNLYATEDGNSISQLYQITSDDAGTTWSAQSARTSEPYNALQPSVDASILYIIEDRISTSEVRMLSRTLVVNKIRRYLQHINRASTY